MINIIIYYDEFLHYSTAWTVPLNAIIDAVLVAILLGIGNVYQCVRLGRQLEQHIRSHKYSMDNIVLEIGQIRLEVGQIRLKVEQQDQKLKDLEMLLRSEPDKVYTKLDVVQEARILSRYPRA